MKRPIVGVTLGSGSSAGLRAVHEDYLRSVAQAAAIPVALPPLPASDVPLLLERLDGILLTGGGDDVDPALYGRARHPKLGRVDRARDDFEIALVREALRRELPVLGICRGLQLLNVALGGTLLQDIPSELQVSVEHTATGEGSRRSHPIAVAAGTRLRGWLGRDTVLVNSSHHQAVDGIADGLLASARSCADGVIEALEAPRARFVLGVQWHPEAFWSQPDSFQALFDAHAEACRS